MAEPPATKNDRIRQELEEKDSLRIRMRELFNRAFQFKEQLWKDEDKFWEEAEKHPLRFKARMVDQNNIFSKPWAARMMAEHEQSDAPRKRVTAESLEAMGLNDDQIEKLATVNDDDEIPEKTNSD